MKREPETGNEDHCAKKKVTVKHRDDRTHSQRSGHKRSVHSDLPRDFIIGADYR